MVLLRHGRTAWNLERRFQGQSDIPLDVVGRSQADVAARHLAQLQPARIIASDLERASQTAAALGAASGVEVTLDPRLREMHAGAWEGCLGSDLADDVQYEAWRRGEDVPAGGGETRSQLADRATVAVDEFVGLLSADQVGVVVTHGGTIRAVLGRTLKLPYEHWRVLGGLANCCWSIIELDRGGWRLTEHNAGSLPEVVIGDDE